jgi:site-specific recombinase XerD
MWTTIVLEADDSPREQSRGGAVGSNMPVKPQRQIPTVSDAVEAYLLDCAANPRLKASSLPSIRSVLRGSDNRSGRRALGTPLYRSHLGRVAMHRITHADLSSWFAQRHEGAAAETVRRGASAFNGFLSFCHVEGWLDQEILQRSLRLGLPRGASNKDWLHPEQVVAFEAQVVPRERFDDYSRFVWTTLICTGVRTDELVRMRPRDLSPRQQELTVIGKGRGEGKRRSIPVDSDFVSAWREHTLRFELKPDDFLFFERRRVFDGADDRTGHWEYGRRTARIATSSVRSFVKALREEAEDVVRSGQMSIEVLPEFALQPKTLRKTYACNQLIFKELGVGGLTARQLQVCLGHEDMQTTQIYLADVEKYLGRAFKPVSTGRGAALAVDAMKQRQLETA